MFPHPHDFKFWEFLQHRSAQVIQLDLDRVEVRWVGDRNPATVDVDGVIERVRSVLRAPVDVTITKVDAIPRTRSGKFEEFISLVPPD